MDAPSHLPSAQERDTIDAIVLASFCALSIVMIGVGDGPFDQMREFDDALHKAGRQFDNFQFVQVDTSAAGRAAVATPRGEATFALNSLMEIPEQCARTPGGELGISQSRHSTSPESCVEARRRTDRVVTPFRLDHVLPLSMTCAGTGQSSNWGSWAAPARLLSAPPGPRPCAAAAPSARRPLRTGRRKLMLPFLPSPRADHLPPSLHIARPSGPPSRCPPPDAGPPQRPSVVQGGTSFTAQPSAPPPPPPSAAASSGSGFAAMAGAASGEGGHWGDGGDGRGPSEVPEDFFCPITQARGFSPK